MAENPPSDSPPDLAGELHALVSYLHASCNRDLFDAIAIEELSFSQLQLLDRLRGSQRRPTVRQCATLMRLCPPSGSRSVEHLARRGFVLREPDESDARVKRVAITEEGAAVITRLHAARRDQIATFTGELEEDERRALSELLSRLLRREEIAACRLARTI
jgi:DNA-binding MarR family transcriptional regulator